MIQNKKILILGLGNDILHDDRIGLQLVADIEKDFSDTNICFRSMASGGFEIVEVISHFDKVILIDAIKTKDGIPGDVTYFNLNNFRETLHLSGLHDINFIQAHELFGNLYPGLTGDIHVIAVEILEDMVFSEDMSSILKTRYTEIKKNVTEIIAQILIN